MLKSDSLIPYQVLKIAILAEKFAQDYKWYVDVVLNLIRIAGDYIADEVRLHFFIYLQLCFFLCY